MSVAETRLKENFPPILMTLVSLMVALVFENLISEMATRPGVLEGNPETFFVWAQTIALGIGSLMFWWTISVHAATLKIVFSPRDSFTAVVGGVMFIVLASTLGSKTAVPWTYVFAALFAVAFIGWRDFGRLYSADPAVDGDETTHRASRWVVLFAGLSLCLLTAAFDVGWIPLHGLAVGILLGLGLAIIAHVFWYAEWKRAVGMG